MSRRNMLPAALENSLSTYYFAHSGVILTLVHFRKEVICDAPLLHIDSRVGLNVVHSDGKVSILFADIYRGPCEP